MGLHLLITVLCLLICRSVLGQFHVYKSEPTHRSPLLNITVHPDDPSRLSDGYVFIAPFTFGDKDHYGPLIYNKKGDVVWNGIDSVSAGRRVSSFHTCDYMGKKGEHLCWSEANVKGFMHSKGSQRFLNQQYERKGGIFSGTGDLEQPMDYELNVLDGGNSLLQVVYNTTMMDLTPYNGTQDGTVYNGCFQEVEIETQAVLFAWCMLDHLPIWDTHMFLDIENKINFSEPGGGNGAKFYPWDPTHINSADKSKEGDYIISLRNLYQVMKIAGENNSAGEEPGTVLWRLGGDSSTVDLESNSTLDGTIQMARFISSDDDSDTISLFNNAYQLNASRPNATSTGKIIKVDKNTLTAKVLHEYPNPNGRMSNAQGSVSVLPNRNVFIGWGTVPQLTEFAEDGTVLLDATFGEVGKHFNYRAYTEPWVADPQTSPKLVVYTKNCSSTPLTAYVSWNGATEVRDWRVKTSIFEDGPWISAGTFPKDGFETVIDLSATKASWMVRSAKAALGFTPYVLVEALDQKTNVLGTVRAKTWVPREEMITLGNCDDFGCNEPQFFEYKPALSDASSCKTAASSPILALVVVVAFVGLFGYLLKVTVVWLARRRQIGPKYDKIEMDSYND